MGALETKTAIIAGASRGIGRAIAHRFIAEGAERVFITGRDPDRLRATAEELGPRATPVPGDVADLTDLDRLYATVAETVSHLDIVVANAAVGLTAPLDSVTPEQFDTTYNTDTRGVFFTIQKRCPCCAMTARSC
jgi:NAD(P)-dependent dehydrogenase (short-subunit alcohol dehydrogenase family)